MALLLPRIYVYKITFLEVPHYYYGAHLEKKYNEYYMGSPVANKDFWIFYTPQKEIIKEFPYNDESWLDALDFEEILIKPVYKTDPLCLNENCRGRLSLEACRKGGLVNKENGTGIYAMTPEQRSEASRKGGKIGGKISGQKSYENGTGIFAMTPEQKSEAGKKAAQKNRENGTAIFSQTSEQRSESGKKGGLVNKENGTGIFAMTPEQKSEAGKKAAQKNRENGIGLFGLTSEQLSESGKKGGKASASQRWKCTVTGHVSNAGGLSLYQRSCGIDTSNRIRIK